MTQTERNALRRDLQNPVDLFTLIVRNNPTAISNNFQSWGLSYGNSGQKEIVAELLRLWDAGGQYQDQAIALVSVPYQFNVLPPDFDLVITGQNAPLMMQKRNEDGEQGAWYSDINWGNIIDHIFDGVDNILNGGNGNGDAPPPPPPPGDDDDETNWVQYGVIGGVVVLIIIALIVALKK